MQQHLDICKIFANTLLSNEVDSLAGSKYLHEKPLEGRYSRWGQYHRNMHIAYSL
jgi:hypothetical protein